MTTTVSSTEVVVSVEPLFTESERIALSGFLASYSGLTRDAYSLDLRMFTAWCQQHGLHLFQARRADIECFGRDMETRGRARVTIARRLCTIAGFYRYARRGGTARALTRRSRTSPAAGLRIARRRAGPQRGRRAARRRGTGCTERARPHLTVGHQRATHLRGTRRGHRQTRPRTWPPHPDRAAQGRQDRHHPARPAYRPRDRPRDR